MFNRLNKKVFSASSLKFEDTSNIVVESVKISTNANGYYEVVLSKPPKGDVISIVVNIGTEDIVIDGSTNITGNIVSFLKDSSEMLDGRYAEVKYLADY